MKTQFLRCRQGVSLKAVGTAGRSLSAFADNRIKLQLPEPMRGFNTALAAGENWAGL